MANEIISTLKAVTPGTAKNSGQVSKPEIAEVPVDNSSTLPKEETALTVPINGVVKADLSVAVSNINSFVQNVTRDLSFKMDEGSGQTVIKVIDSESGKLIRQIPSEEVLAMATQISSVSDSGQQADSLPKGFLFSDST